MVSRANVPRKMTSATRLTEEEEIELEWESVWERIKDRMEASFCKIKREQKADFDALKKAILDLSISSQGRSMETTDASSGNCKSQLELPKFVDDRDFHKSIDVDRAIADEDLMEQHSSESYEEMDIDLKIGVEDCIRVSTEIEDIEFLRSDTQHDEVIGGKMGKQFDIEVESAAMWQPRPIVHFELRFGVDARAVERLDHGTMNGIEYVQHIVAFSCYRTCSQAKEFKETERLPIARRNASLRELAVALKVVTNLMRLSIRFPKPMVKMKIMKFASIVGYEEEEEEEIKMSAIVCGKRSYFEDIDAGASSPAAASLPAYKKLRCSSSTSPVRFTYSPPVHTSSVDQLKDLFPELEIQLLEKALEESVNDLDLAIKKLHEFCRGHVNEKIDTTEENATMEKVASQTSGDSVPLQEPQTQNNLPADGAEWVDLFVREMMSATSIDDARFRAASILESLEKSISPRACAEAAQNSYKENLMLKEHIEVLLRDNAILKRGVAIQYEIPKPTVKMKHERLGSEIPKPSVKLKVWEGKAREAWLHDSLWTRNLKGEGLLRSQIVEGRSPADASWELPTGLWQRFSWFLVDKEP
ncbi:uncharacterized protein LOC121774717 [Salvia splendens]|uniref:uncharacterized protein LOC121774717 n=1 Tax=Salvia splendens TaxID=180675 RepID=UPI001C277B6F|nr:uncharacterized protein LOC121774717 [Salvia splendens]